MLLGIAHALNGRSRLRGGGAGHHQEVVEDLGAAHHHAWIIGLWLRSLETAGLVNRGSDGIYRDLYGPGRAELAAARTSMESARLALGYPKELAELLLGSLRLLPELLRDEVSVQVLLFPDGDLATAEAVYRSNVVSRYLNAAAAEVLRDLVGRERRPLRALELGAGIGATTADLLPVLTGTEVDFYLFTDVSSFFLSAARRRFQQEPSSACMRYAKVDITQELAGQLKDHLRAGQADLDLVVAATMAHNAPHVGRLLEEIAAMLSPAGRVVLIETVHEHPQSLTSMPFALSSRHAGGLPARTDERAGTARTYLRRDEWIGWMEHAGLRPEVDLPFDGDPLGALSQRLLVGCRSDLSPTAEEFT